MNKLRARNRLALNDPVSPDRVPAVSLSVSCCLFSHSQAVVRPFLLLVLWPSSDPDLLPTGPAEFEPWLTLSSISNRFLARGLLIALMMEALKTIETLVNSYDSTWRYKAEENNVLVWMDTTDFLIWRCLSSGILVQFYRRFRDASCLHHQGALIMEV
jgi:hypothetical protein